MFERCITLYTQKHTKQGGLTATGYNDSSDGGVDNVTQQFTYTEVDIVYLGMHCVIQSHAPLSTITNQCSSTMANHQRYQPRTKVFLYTLCSQNILKL